MIKSVQMIGYPRSGNNWQHNRITLFLHKCLGQKMSLMESAKILNPSHLGYDAMAGAKATTTVKNALIDVQKANSLSVCFRTPCAILSSYHVYLKTNFLALKKELSSDFDSLDNFVKSDWGTTRLCSFLNDLPKIKQNYISLYYEDMFQKESIKVLPKILGIKHNFSSDEIDWIFDNSNFLKLKEGIISPEILGSFRAELLDIGPTKRSRNGKIDSFKEEMTQDSQEYILNFLDKNCKLDSYRKRYL